MYKVFIRGPRRSGKSYMLATMISDAAEKANQEILVISPDFNTSNYLIELVLKKLKDTGVFKSLGYYDRMMHLNNNTIIRFVYNDKIVRGKNADYIAIDQYDRLSDDLIAAITPLAGKDGYLWLTETDDE